MGVDRARCNILPINVNRNCNVLNQINKMEEEEKEIVSYGTTTNNCQCPFCGENITGESFQGMLDSKVEHIKLCVRKLIKNEEPFKKIN
jgi:hypothetical protein